MAQLSKNTGASVTDELVVPPEVTMTLLDITIAGRRFSIARELHADNQFHQRYSVDGRDVPVQRYLELVATAVAAKSIPVT
jgi:hypothetical protein